MARKSGPTPKSSGERQGHRSGAQIVPLSGGLKDIPPPPRGISKAVEKEWEAFWGSEVAKATGEVDLPAISRLFVYYDEWDRALRAFRRQRYVEGSQKQPKLNPMADHMGKLEAQILKLEAEFGKTPYSRLRLLKDTAAARKSLDDLNRQADADEDEAQTEDEDPRAALDVAASDR